MTDVLMNKAAAMAVKIAEMVDGVLAPLDRQMKQWPAEFRTIMWNAVSVAAASRAAECSTDGASEDHKTERSGR